MRQVAANTLRRFSEAGRRFRRPLAKNWLALPICLGIAVTSLAGQSHDFQSARECSRCHIEIYNQWTQSAHSRAFVDPVYRLVVDKMIEKSGSNPLFCLSCHTPVGSVSGQTFGLPSPWDWEGLDAVAVEGVTCDFCHRISGTENRGRNIATGALVYPGIQRGKVLYGRYGDGETSAHRTEQSSFLLSSEFCSVCHQFKHPLSLTETQNTYREWLASPYPERGIRCQDCHMPTYRGVLASGGPVRERVFAHSFPGGHTEMLRRAATLSVGGNLVAGSGRLQVTGVVRNSGAGHTIPTGLPGLRQMRLELSIRDGGGGLLEQRTFFFGQSLLKADGELALPWEDYSRIVDTRVWPERSRQVDFEVAVKPEWGEQVSVDGRLFLELVKSEVAQELGIAAPDSRLMSHAQERIFLR